MVWESGCQAGCSTASLARRDNGGGFDSPPVGGYSTTGMRDAGSALLESDGKLCPCTFDDRAGRRLRQ